jgi:photosystem II stability/assembly factor-like uncharacterized protein
LLAGCGGGGGTAGLPSGDHVHSLGVTSDGDLLLGLHGGLYRSGDGVTWELAGLQGEDAMVIASVADQPVFVAGHDVLYRSDDFGESFTPLQPPDLPGLDIHAFAQSPTDGRSVYAYVVGHGLYFSGDAGDTWEQRASMGQLPQDLFGMAVAGGGSETLVMVGTESGILRSEDGGRSLSRVAEVPAWAVTVEPMDPQVVWTLTAAGLMRSGDGGGTWETASTLPEVEGRPVALAVGDDAMWLVTEEPRALYRSLDSGDSWERVVGS